MPSTNDTITHSTIITGNVQERERYTLAHISAQPISNLDADMSQLNLKQTSSSSPTPPTPPPTPPTPPTPPSTPQVEKAKERLTPPSTTNQQLDRIGALALKFK